VYTTPLNFLEAVSRRWNINFDLAANEENNAVDRLEGVPIGRFFSEDDDALTQDWSAIPYPIDWVGDGYLWLNPPFSEIKKWVAKAAYESSKGARIVMLLPDAAGSDWYLRFVKPNAMTIHLIGRITFEFRHTKDAKPDKHGKKRYLVGDQNTDPFPKDCMLCIFDSGMEGQNWWDWRMG
jgi:phage N-6-adenine-methyltransferase